MAHFHIAVFLGGGGNHLTKIRAESHKYAIIINFALAFLAIPSATNLNAVELRSYCGNNQNCTINSAQDEITNSGSFSQVGTLNISASITNFINRGTISITSNNTTTIAISTSNGRVTNFSNYGSVLTSQGTLYALTIGAGTDTAGFVNIYNDYNGYIAGGLNITGSNQSPISITNYGTMGGVNATTNAIRTITMDNLGMINFAGNTRNHFNNIHLVIKNYTMQISENATTFNATRAATDNSHIVLAGTKSASFADNNSKLILDFGGDFEINKEYSLSRLIVDENGNSLLNVPFNRLTTRNDIFTLTQSGNNFIINAEPSNSTISNLYKANIKTINSLFLQSNKMIYPSKFKGKRLSTRNPQRRVIRRVSENANPFFNAESPKGESKSNESLDISQDFSYLLALDSLDSLQNNESFFYNSDSLLLAQSANQMAIQQRRAMQNPRARATSQVSNKYYFVLTPFVNYNTYNKSGRYNLSGLEYGFISAFSGKLGFGNTLGAHFGFSYGSLGDKDDSLLKLTSANLMLGLNYKLDLFWNMYVKARGDFYYFLNEVSSVAFDKLKPNSMGFGVSVAYGKDFNFGAGGVLGLELGVDYKGLNANAISVDSLDNSSKDTYDKALYHLVYVDLGLNYDKYFGTSAGLWGINIGAGGRMNLTPKLAKSTIAILNGTRSVDMTIDNDKFLGYVNAGFSYGFEAQKFGMEFGIEYYGNFGDRSMSNAGSFEWKTRW